MPANGDSDILNPAAFQKAEQLDRAVRLGIARLSTFDKWMAVIGLSLATCIELGTQVAVNVILVDMKGNVAASQDEISWVIIVYSMAYLSVLPLSDWFARRVGHRNHLVLSLLLYASGAFGCFLSNNLWQLLVARAVMGLGGGAFLVRALVSLFNLNDPSHRARPLFVFAMFVTSSRALMPVLFSAVTDSGRWNLAFLVQVPLALLAATILYLFLPGRLELAPEPPPTDYLGISLIVAGLCTFQIAMSRGEQDLWLQSSLIRWMLALSVICLSAFVVWDTRRKNVNPVLNLRVLLAEPVLASGSGLALILGALLASGLYVFPQYLRLIAGYDVRQTAYFFCFDGIATFLGIFLGVKLMRQLSPRVVTLFGLLVCLAANILFVYTLTPDTPASSLCAILFLHGLSLGVMLPGVTNTLLGHSRLKYIGFGMTIYFFLRQLGSALGVAATVALVDIRETLHSSRLLDVANRLNPTTDQVLRHFSRLLSAKGLPPNRAVLGSYQLLQGLVMKQTALLAFIDVFWGLGVVALLGVLIIVLLWQSDQKVVPVPSSFNHY